MNINFDDRQNVRPSTTPLRAPNVYEDSKALYSAERAGFAEIGRAAQNASAAIAQCGDLLTRYDQTMLQRSFVEDKQRLDIECAGLFSEQLYALSKDPNQPKTAEELKVRLDDIKKSVRENVSGWKRENFRNYDRWESEIDNVVEAHTATMTINAMERWMVDQDRRSMQLYDVQMQNALAVGDLKKAETVTAETKAVFPQHAKILDEKLKAVKFGIEAKILSADIGTKVDTYGENVSTLLNGLLDQKNQEEVPEEPSDASRSEQLLYRREMDNLEKQREEQLGREYFEEAIEFENLRFNEIAAQIDSAEFLDQRQKELEKKRVKKALREQTEAVWRSYNDAKVESQKKNSENIKELLWNGGFQKDDRFGHLKLDDGGLVGPNRSLFKFIDQKTGGMEVSTETKTIAYIAASKLNPGSASFGEEAVKILEEARLSGVTKSDYAQIYQTISDMAAGKVKMNEGARNDIYAHVLAKINMVYEKDFKTLDLARRDPITAPIVDEMVLTISNIGYTISDYNSAMNMVDGFFAKAVNATDKVRTLEAAATRLNSIVHGGYVKRSEYSKNAAGMIASSAEKEEQEKLTPVKEPPKPAAKETNDKTDTSKPRNFVARFLNSQKEAFND